MQSDKLPDPTNLVCASLRSSLKTTQPLKAMNYYMSATRSPVLIVLTDGQVAEIAMANIMLEYTWLSFDPLNLVHLRKVQSSNPN